MYDSGVVGKKTSQQTCLERLLSFRQRSIGCTGLDGNFGQRLCIFLQKDRWLLSHFPSISPSVHYCNHSSFAGLLGVDLGPRLKNQNQIPNRVFGVRPEPLTQSVWGNETQHRLSFSRSTDKVTLCGFKGDRVNVAQWVVSGAHFAPDQLNVGKNKGKIRYHSVV